MRGGMEGFHSWKFINNNLALGLRNSSEGFIIPSLFIIYKYITCIILYISYNKDMKNNIKTIAKKETNGMQ